MACFINGQFLIKAVIIYLLIKIFLLYRNDWLKQLLLFRDSRMLSDDALAKLELSIQKIFGKPSLRSRSGIAGQKIKGH